MNTYLITYNLTLISEDGPYYVRLVNKIKSFQYWAKPLRNVWFIKTTWDTKSVLDYLNTDLYKGDKLLVIEVANNWWSINLDSDVINWMKGGL